METIKNIELSERSFNVFTDTSPLIIKKIYVLAALELERYKAQINEQISEEMQINDNNIIEKNENKKDINYRDEALQKEIDKIINNHWRGAEACSVK